MKKNRGAGKRLRRAIKKKATDYRVYRLRPAEVLGYGALFLAGMSLAGELMFNRFWVGSAAGALLLPLFYSKTRTALNRRRKERLEEEFCRYMQLTAASLAGGTALENVFREVADSTAAGGGRRGFMEAEFRVIDRLIGLHYDSVDAFGRFASRTGSRDIEAIAAALAGVAEKGGDLTELMKNGVHSLRIKQETEREIKRKLALPRLNHQILTVMPFAFLLLLRNLSPEYAASLYEGAGLAAMAAVALLVGLAWLLGDRVGRSQIPSRRKEEKNVSF